MVLTLDKPSNFEDFKDDHEIHRKLVERPSGHKRISG